LHLWRSALHTALVKAEQLFSAPLQKQGHSSLVPLQLHLWRSALHTALVRANSNQTQSYTQMEAEKRSHT
ncbi:TPA: hypothetical protein ACH3X2_004785, partial [Trebouxia sp. C0005]